jgi:WD40 repeat protein
VAGAAWLGVTAAEPLRPAKPNVALLAPAPLAEAPGVPPAVEVKPFRLAAPHALDCIDGVAFSPERGAMALWHNDQTVTVWNLITGKYVATLRGHKANSGSQFALSADGKAVFAWGGKALRTWDVKSGKMRTLFDLAKGEVKPYLSAGAVAPDGSRIATVHDGGGCSSLIRTWDVGRSKELWKFNNADGSQIVHSLAFSPDGKRLAAGTQDGLIKVFDAATGKILATWRDDRRCVKLTWSADGKRLASTRRLKGGDEVVTWDARASEVVGVVGPLESVDDEALSPDGKKLAVLQGARLTLWQVPGKKPLGHKELRRGQCGLTWSPDGKSVIVVREEPKLAEEVVVDASELTAKK